MPHGPAEPQSLRGLRLLHDRDPAASWVSWLQAHGPAGLDSRAGPRFTSTDLVLRAAAQGLGVALARDRLVAEDRATGVLLRPFGEELAVSLPDAYWIVLPPGSDQRIAVRSVVAWLKSQTAVGPAPLASAPSEPLAEADTQR